MDANWYLLCGETDSAVHTHIVFIKWKMMGIVYKMTYIKLQTKSLITK